MAFLPHLLDSRDLASSTLEVDHFFHFGQARELGEPSRSLRVKLRHPSRLLGVILIML